MYRRWQSPEDHFQYLINQHKEKYANVLNDTNNNDNEKQTSVKPTTGKNDEMQLDGDDNQLDLNNIDMDNDIEMTNSMPPIIASKKSSPTTRSGTTSRSRSRRGSVDIDMIDNSNVIVGVPYIDYSP